jgi:putative SOS response-associated peptidase YedK
VLADGFFEWQATGQRKQPYLVGLPTGEPLAFAGVWERWQKADEAAGPQAPDLVRARFLRGRRPINPL